MNRMDAVMKKSGAFVSFLLTAASGLVAGPYSAATNDPANVFDAPVPGFVGPQGEGIVHPDNEVNPLFAGWASGVADYSPAPEVAGPWADPSKGLGPVTGDNFDIVSLGDLNGTQITNGVAPGSITVTFDAPIRNKSGADFVCFENGALSGGGAGVAGQIFGELAYVEVSSDGVNFARMPSRSLTPSLVGPYGTLDASNIAGLAGKHLNAAGGSWGTPFDLGALAGHPLVVAGSVDLAAITHVRLVDIPGNGFFKDSLGSPIYDSWVTWGSGGHDVDAVGVISRDLDFDTWADQKGLAGDERAPSADPDADGLANLLEYASGLSPLAPDAPKAWQTISRSGGRLSLTCRRDERAVDLVLEVEASADLKSWQTIARSTGGGPFQAVAPHAPQIVEAAAHPIVTVGVLRSATITDEQSGAASRFMRLRVRKES